MRRVVVVVLLMLFTPSMACTSAGDELRSSPTVGTTSPTSPGPTSSSSAPPKGPVRIGSVAVADHLEQPTAFTFLPDGRILYAERVTGAIRLLDPSSGRDTAFFVIDDLVADITDAAGLLGIAVDPGYPKQPFVYAFATRSTEEGDRSQVVRIEVDGDRGTTMDVIFDPGIPVFTRHNGGRIVFGGDGDLYVVVGEHDRYTPSQDLHDPSGKIHRITTEGASAPGNPLSGSTVFAHGIRNSFGMAFDPDSGSLWYTDNGPDCNDEVNRVVAGGNYGWGPSADCDLDPGSPTSTNRDGSDPILPVWTFPRTIGITGLAFCGGCGLGDASDGALFIGDYNYLAIHRLTLTGDGERAVRDKVVYEHPRHVLSIEVAPDGTLYFSDPGGIYRLVPVSPA